MTAPAILPRIVTRRPLRAPRGDVVATTSGPWRQAASGGVPISWRGRIRQVCWAVVLGALALAGLRLPAQAQLLREFRPQFTTNNRGDISIIGNTLMSCNPKAVSDALENLAAISPLFTPEEADKPPQIYQTCDPNIAVQGEGFIKVQGEPVPAEGIYLSDQGYRMTPINLATPLGMTNSSSAEWVLPPRASVLWAGLYWSARRIQSEQAKKFMVCDPSRKASPDMVCFATPTSGYQLKTGTLGPDFGPNDVYQNFVDVTTEVHAGGSGTYSVADVEAQDGNDGLGFFAGWALVIVIRDPMQPLRNMTVFNGFAHVNGNDQSKPNLTTVTVPVTGFLTPQNGAVTTHVGVVSYEGDLGATGDTLTLNGQQIGDAVHVKDNFFNSGISHLGRSITGNSPDFINQLGIDIAMVDASGMLPNGATSATFEFFSAAESYYPGVITFATDFFLPVVEAVKTVRDLNGGDTLPEDILEYTIVLKNIGNDGAVNQVLTDTIPAGTTYVPRSLRITAGANAGGLLTDAPGDDVAEFTGSSVVFRLGTGATATAGGTLAPDQSTTVVFRVQINATAAPASTISDQAVATYHSQTLPNLSFDVRSDSALTTPGRQPTDVIVDEARAALTLHKSAAPDPVLAGQRLTYTLEVTNAGPHNAVNVVLADATPLHTTFVDAIAVDGWTLTFPDPGGTGPIIFRSPDVPPTVPAAPLMFTIVVQVDPAVPSGTQIHNTATLTSPIDPDPDTAATTVTVSGDLDLSITKTDGQTLTVPGAVVTYTLLVRNAGPSAVTGARVDDPVPATLFGVTWTCTASPGSSCPASGVGAIDVLVDLLVGGTATFTLSATVDPAAQGAIVNEATVKVPQEVRALPDTSDPNPGNNTARDATLVVAAADIAVRKTVNNATPQVGQTVTFTVTATNNGPHPATGVQLSDGVPLGLAFVSATPSQGTYTPTTGVWDIGALAVNTQATLTLVVRVELAGLIRNVAEKIAGDQFDPNTSNNSSGVDLTSTPVPEADIEVRKSADPLVLPVGSDVTFTVTVTNKGPSAATGVALTDVLPAGLALVSATPSQGTYTPTTGVWTLGALAVGAQTTLTLRATVQEAGAFTNRAAKTAQGELDPNPGNDVSGVTINGEEADVQVVKTVDRTMPLVGETVTFTVTVTNNGPSAVSGVEVLDVLSARLSVVRAAPSQGTYTAATGRWAVGTLAAVGAAATATLQVTARVTEAGPLTNLAVKIAQDQPDPNPANDQDGVARPGLPVADLVVTKSHGVDRVVPGTEVVYTVVVTNRGPSSVIGAIVNDPIPLLLRDPTRGLRAFEDLTWTCAASAGSACPAGGMGDVLTTVDLLVEGTATLTLRGRVTPAAVGTVGNTVTVTAPAEVLDPLLGNNSATDTERLTPLADLSITKTDEVASVVPGTLVRYTLVVRNAGPSAVLNARVQDPASAALVGVAWTCVASAGSSCRAKGTGPLATTVHLAVGGTATFTLTGIVVVAAPGTLANTATVTPPSGVTDPVLDNNTATDTHAVLRPPVFGPPAGRKTVQGGESPDLEWRVVWLNNANAVPLRLRGLDPIPGATTYVDGSVTCVARGQSTVVRCAFDAATNQLVYDGTVGPDPGATTEEQAANAVIITFRTAVLPGVTQVANQALAHWDANGNGTVDDDIAPARDRSAQGPRLASTIPRWSPCPAWCASSSSASWRSRCHHRQ